MGNAASSPRRTGNGARAGRTHLPGGLARHRRIDPSPRLESDQPFPVPMLPGHCTVSERSTTPSTGSNDDPPRLLHIVLSRKNARIAGERIAENPLVSRPDHRDGRRLAHEQLDTVTPLISRPPSITEAPSAIAISGPNRKRT